MITIVLRNPTSSPNNPFKIVLSDSPIPPQSDNNYTIVRRRMTGFWSFVAWLVLSNL